MGQSSRLRKNLINFNGGDTKIFQQPNYSLHRITKVSSLSPLSSNKEDSENGEIANQNVPVKAIAGLLAFGAAAYGISQNVDFNGLIQEVLAKVSDLGPYGYVYFAAVMLFLQLLFMSILQSSYHPCNVLLLNSFEDLYFTGSASSTSGTNDSFKWLFVWVISG